MYQKKNNIIYMAVTPDEFELPVFVADNIKELGKLTGLSKNTICSRISKGLNGKNSEYKIVKVCIKSVDF